MNSERITFLIAIDTSLAEYIIKIRLLQKIFKNHLKSSKPRYKHGLNLKIQYPNNF